MLLLVLGFFFLIQSLSLSASLLRSLHPFALMHTPKDPAKMLLLAVAAMKRSEFMSEQRNEKRVFALLFKHFF